MSPVPEILLDVCRNPFLAVGVPIGLGALSGIITGKTARSPWFTEMRAPAGNPPRQAFGPVWTVLYGLMGYASHLAVKSLDAAVTPNATASANKSLRLYWTQLGLNLLWTPLFFGAKQKELALVDMALLLGTVVSMTIEMHDLRTDFSTTWLLAPYCAWLGYASYLNAGYVWLNWNRRNV
ncbi:TspO/MBR-related protein [Kockovaella imperatae]|uniref:TspO/MBR-related protein n=1 Tax=Kockovaella imperatae TaxID=4999 RepID=A0A1Y1UGK6_9TREE|nr:TspO/MBR-related protein [Kockovaella imperatae]ORX37193.1 TspO/MBR-related protein [Kockovaella imperatae]